MERTDIRKVSRFLSHHLDNITEIGPEEVVKIRQSIYFLTYLTGGPEVRKKNSRMVTGSKGEGFCFRNSDTDQMITIQDVAIIQQHDSIPEEDQTKTILVTDNTNCRSGYTLLKLHQVGENAEQELIDALIEVDGSWYLSSVVYVSNYLLPGCYLHGPCSTLPDDYTGDSDLAFSFHCRSWPDSLSNFRYRTKHCVWPSRKLVLDIIRNGCHLVAIGDKHSNLFAMQWRISFVAAEVFLVLSFNHVQLKTYGLLKMFLKECIEHDPFIEHLLCSYFMKTIVFHAIEHSRPSMWVDENLIQCFWYCFTILMECIQTGYLPNYFILSHNMFLSNVTGDNRKRLIQVLSKYRHMGWNCLFLCPILRSLPQTIYNSRSDYPSDSNQSAVLAECNGDLLIAVQYGTVGFYDVASLLILAQTAFLDIQDDIITDSILLYLMSAITNNSRNGITDHIQNYVVGSNKSVYSQTRRYKRLLHVSSATDVCSGYLSLATFYYNVGCYDKAYEVARHVVFACQQRTVIQLNPQANFHAYCKEMCGKGYTTLQKAKRSFLTLYSMHKRYNRLYPAELDLEIEADKTFITLPPLPYAIFLLVLSTYRQGKTDQSRIILDDLLAARTNPNCRISIYPTIHNLVGICHQLLGDTRQAIKAFEDSCRQNPDNSAAANRIAILRKTRKEALVDEEDVQLDYYNVPSQHQSNDRDMSYTYKTMYNTDPDSFVNCS
ncbi:uncharacterized protein LOC132563720 [Ylistrum balloti]|uniref:uncharacterized protein LOC132563720 n=1 Tax=Ylistrum balloti TaxID=509963 RepID=UPI0029058770|nr:uncharacterized protein LOC132563720 [Ylistrum balloti]